MGGSTVLVKVVSKSFSLVHCSTQRKSKLIFTQCSGIGSEVL